MKTVGDGMKVRKNRGGLFTLKYVDEEGLRSLLTMIDGAGLCERRAFDGVKRQIEKLINK